jgi:acyl-CoA synthetase (AMP-forming)/AMP-acid ligase II
MHPAATLIDAATGAVTTRRDVEDRCQALSGLPCGVALVAAGLSVRSAVDYLAALESGRPVILLDPQSDLETMVSRFVPAVVLGVDRPLPGYTPGPGLQSATAPAPHPELGVLLPTSGSTGDPKLVRLSRDAVRANALSIAATLGIDGDAVAPTTLPLFYSYGLSVLNSHLISGATVVLESTGMMSRAFWDAVDEFGATSLAAVPAQYEMLRRLRFDPCRHPTLTSLTQAGGRLRPELVADFAERMNGELYVMYGQTEATARMAVLPPHELPVRPGSVGLAVPGGSFEIRDGEVFYQGPNVMMGYATGAADLARGDELNGVLATGDLGRLDADGFLTLTGRLKRIGKVFGVRLNLDDVEAMVTGLGPVAAVSDGDRIVLWTESAAAEDRQTAASRLADRLRLHPSGFDVRALDRLPLLANGKIDYRALEAAL